MSPTSPDADRKLLFTSPSLANTQIRLIQPPFLKRYMSRTQPGLPLFSTESNSIRNKTSSAWIRSKTSMLDDGGKVIGEIDWKRDAIRAESKTGSGSGMLDVAITVLPVRKGEPYLFTWNGKQYFLLKTKKQFIIQPRSNTHVVVGDDIGRDPILTFRLHTKHFFKADEYPQITIHKGKYNAIEENGSMAALVLVLIWVAMKEQLGKADVESEEAAGESEIPDAIDGDEPEPAEGNVDVPDTAGSPVDNGGIGGDYGPGATGGGSLAPDTIPEAPVHHHKGDNNPITSPHISPFTPHLVAQTHEPKQTPYTAHTYTHAHTHSPTHYTQHDTGFSSHSHSHSHSHGHDSFASSGGGGGFGGGGFSGGGFGGSGI